MKTLMFARKYLLEIWRSQQVFWLFILFPAVMVLIYYFAFGQNTGMSGYITVVVINQDTGEHGEGLIQAIKEAEFDGKAAITVWEGYSREEAETLLNEGKAAMLATIPSQFSAALQNDLPQPVEIEVQGDPLLDTYAFAYSFLDETIREYCDQITGWRQDLPASLEFLPNTGTLNDFQIGVPGLIVFGIMFGIITNALLLTRETSDGTIKRIKVSNARAGHFLGGITLAGVILSLAQMLVTFGTAAAVGFKPLGNLWLAIGIGMTASFSAVGAGFIAASFSRSEGEATGYGTGLMVPLVFLSGAVYPLPAMELFHIGETRVQLYDIFPSALATRALKKVILYGEGYGGVSYEFAGMALLSSALLIGGIWLYQKRVLEK